MQELYGDGAVTDGCGDPLHRATAHIADSEDTWHRCLDEKRGTSVSGLGNVGSADDETALVTLQDAVHPIGVR